MDKERLITFIKGYIARAQEGYHEVLAILAIEPQRLSGANDLLGEVNDLFYFSAILTQFPALLVELESDDHTPEQVIANVKIKISVLINKICNPNVPVSPLVDLTRRAQCAVLTKLIPPLT